MCRLCGQTALASSSCLHAPHAMQLCSTPLLCYPHKCHPFACSTTLCDAALSSHSFQLLCCARADMYRLMCRAGLSCVLTSR
jgi:hypothetical protein